MSWYYLKSSILGEEQEGPIDHAEFVEKVRDGEVE